MLKIDNSGSIKIGSYSKEDKISWSGEFRELEKYYLKICETWHEKRKSEFLMGRHLIHLTLKNNGMNWRQPIGVGEKREPIFPKNLSGSLTHNNQMVVFFCREGSFIIGIDVESRGRIKEKIEREILRDEDFLFLNSEETEFTRDDYITLIFSAKESCFKGLYPYVREYFGFKDAYLSKINYKQKKFEVVVLKKFANGFGGRSYPLLLKGKFQFDDSNIFTYLDPIPASDFL